MKPITVRKYGRTPTLKIRNELFIIYRHGVCSNEGKKSGNLRIRSDHSREKEGSILPSYAVRIKRKLRCNDTDRCHLYTFGGAFSTRSLAYTKGRKLIVWEEAFFIPFTETSLPPR